MTQEKLLLQVVTTFFYFNNLSKRANNYQKE
jgi:hypothetical protein